jgi:hypothetical protein
VTSIVRNGPTDEQLNACDAGAITLWRLGDFWEAFDQSAERLRPVLDLTMTRYGSRCLCGFPLHMTHRVTPLLEQAGTVVWMDWDFMRNVWVRRVSARAEEVSSEQDRSAGA